MTTHLHAIAMRTKAANTARAYRDQWRCANGFEGFATGAKIIDEAIRALPLEADHAAILAEAVRLPEIAALIRDVAKGPMIGSLMTSWINDMMKQAKALETP